MHAPWYRSVSFLVCTGVVSLGVVGAAFYANLSYDVDDPRDFAHFPPFKPGVDHNHNDHVGAEYGKIARALHAGRGYADPFAAGTGPTAWMTPPLPLAQWAVLTLTDGSKDALTNAMIVSQAAAVLFTALLVLAAARRTAPHVPLPCVALLIAAALAARFHMCFQMTHDTGIVMAAADVVLIGAVWGGVLASVRRRILWGVAGGVVALVNPIVGLGWGLVTLVEAVHIRNFKSMLLSISVAAAVLSPWIVRNALVFGRFIPAKSNLAYELYQSQVHNTDGRLRGGVFGTHPNTNNTAERREYAALGEIAFLDVKRAAFWTTVRDNPTLFAWKVWDRVLAVTVDYSPMGNEEYERRTLFQFCYLTYALPIFAAVGLSILAWVRRTPRHVTAGALLLACNLAPYAAVSFYERYETPVWGVKILVLVWWLDVVMEGFRNSLRNARAVSPAADTTPQSDGSAGA